MGMFSPDENGWVRDEPLAEPFKYITKKETFEFVKKDGDEVLVKYTPLVTGYYTTQEPTDIITKKLFIECYNRWIKDNN